VPGCRIFIMKDPFMTSPRLPNPAHILLALLILGGIAVAQTGAIRGRVIDSKTKQPVKYAYVDLNTGIENKHYRCSTNENGEFTISNLESGAGRLNIRAYEHKSTSAFVQVFADSIKLVEIELEKTEAILDIDMMCFPKDTCKYLSQFTSSLGKFSVAGTVSQKDDGVGIPFAVVQASYNYTDTNNVTNKGCCRSVSADSLGRFIMKDLNPGEFIIHANYPFPSRSRICDTKSFYSVPDSLYRIDFHLGK
jgi:hypothetical protein